jgi:hypothetical protein
MRRKTWAYVAYDAYRAAANKHVIFPYRLEGVWVFDDASAGLVREPFISGADNILDVLTEHIPEAATGFKIIFLASPFPGYTARVVWTRAEYGVIGFAGQRGKWKDGCVRPSSNISKALPKESLYRRPLKARKIRRCTSRSCLFRQKPLRSKPFGVLSG